MDGNLDNLLGVSNLLVLSREIQDLFSSSKHASTSVLAEAVSNPQRRLLQLARSRAAVSRALLKPGSTTVPPVRPQTPPSPLTAHLPPPSAHPPPQLQAQHLPPNWFSSTEEKRRRGRETETLSGRKRRATGMATPAFLSSSAPWLVKSPLPQQGHAQTLP